MTSFVTIDKCRICGNENLASLIDLGMQALTGKFPNQSAVEIKTMPLELVKCDEKTNPLACGLVQLRHTAQLSEMYGEGYGYRSGLNDMMVAHLQQKVRRIESLLELKDGDLVIDVGSNDATTLKSYHNQNLDLIGVDPSGNNFLEFYPDYIRLIPDFFSYQNISKQLKGKSAKVITSFSMFYDLEAPLEFVKEVYEILEGGGFWIFEQSYLPTMIKNNSYDTICHEHLEYYSLKTVKWMLDRVGFVIVDVELNDVNGGSFSVIARKRKEGSNIEESPVVQKLLQEEDFMGLSSMKPYVEFSQKIKKHREQIHNFFKDCAEKNIKVIGYGASTKGNVLLQYCKLKTKDLSVIADVNPKKFGCYTPGTGIPIVSESEAHNMNPDMFFVLPWHFKKTIIERERQFLKRGGRLVFPLPSFEIVTS